ncbi:MAG TPA: MmgE/PrpD family protein [Thermomicrobiaceae bacterium]|nr:MmgE/PrpD family protein [Thermomicrobiaceae bacterium]
MIVEDLARYVVEQRGRPLPDAVVQAAVRCAVDWFGAAVAGGAMEPTRLLAAAVGDEIGHGAARLVPDGRAAPARTAALVNGAAAHAAEVDDIYSPGLYHPGAPTIAAALAAAESRDADGPSFLRALVVGYEVGDRIAEAINPSHYASWHTTGTVGAIGAAAAVAEVLELNAARFAHALASAATMGAGLQQAFRSDAMSKPLHAGHAAEAGLLAARAAADGFTGALDVLEGEAGFGRAMSGAVDWSAVTAGGDDPRITRTTVKPHVGCGHTFAPVDAALDLRQRGIDPDRIRRIRVDSYRVAREVAGIARPSTPFEAKFSIPFCVATAIVYGAVRLAAFDARRLDDPALRGLIERTEIAVDDEHERAFPRLRGARVSVTLDDGRVETADRWTRRGDPDDPLSDVELDAKFRELAGEVVGVVAAQRLGRTLWDLPHLDRVRRLPLAAPVAAT